MALFERVKKRLSGEPLTDSDNKISELCDLASVRICLRVREPSLPELLEPIAADAVVKMWRRWNYEGISSESADTITTSFVQDVLAEYDDEFQAYIEQKENKSGAKVVRFI